MGASLASGHLDDSAVSCPWHGWRFDVRDGSWCDNRRLKTDVFEVRVVGDQIEVATEPTPKAEDDLTH
jgi:nitrite reductase (NADH) small subunit/3-phenylpropionate/trans-cinnamate dioxygenase ferredoxin subunit